MLQSVIDVHAAKQRYEVQPAETNKAVEQLQAQEQQAAGGKAVSDVMASWYKETDLWPEHMAATALQPAATATSPGSSSSSGAKESSDAHSESSDSNSSSSDGDENMDNDSSSDSSESWADSGNAMEGPVDAAADIGAMHSSARIRKPRQYTDYAELASSSRSDSSTDDNDVDSDGGTAATAAALGWQGKSLAKYRSFIEL